ncbi:kinase-like protein [Penicillium alfredii]|uniref:Kinase-like protein n=1 Tax=Penicillium alfredii TaxID=1506179 RepID=A0A9W9JTY3_9EURO|nr:kinase-like protein [Penicillium alfredii]KAJ5081525.1 kinase-like protein [Penicillium alfredii]
MRLNIIGAGQFSIIHKLSDTVVRKVPADKSYFYSARAVEIEGRVYGHLGRNKRIARCINWGDDFVDLRYERKGDLETYLKNTRLTDHAKYRIARQAIKAVAFIHKKDVIHSDLSARQFLMDKKYNIRLSDFGGSSLQGSEAIVMENASHFLPRDEDSSNSVQSDLFALGSTIYEILLGKKPYEGAEEDDIQRYFSQGVFPTLEEIRNWQWENVIRKCWKCEYDCASDILKDTLSPSCFMRVFARI